MGNDKNFHVTLSEVSEYSYSYSREEVINLLLLSIAEDRTGAISQEQLEALSDSKLNAMFREKLNDSWNETSCPVRDDLERCRDVTASHFNVNY